MFARPGQCAYTFAIVTEPAGQFKFTHQQMKDIKKFRLIILPFRLVIGLTFFALIAGGFKRFFGQLPGQAFAVLFSVFLLAERLFQAPDLGGERRDRGSVFLLWVCLGFSYALGVVDYFWIRPHWTLLDYGWRWVAIGTGLFLAGLLLRCIAIRTLGRFFTISVRLHDEHHLVKTGVYRIIRHPAYTGLIILVLGLDTLFASVLSYAAFAVFAIPSLIYRIRIEEGMLVEHFGDEYEEYRKKTKRLVPFLY